MTSYGRTATEDSHAARHAARRGAVAREALPAETPAAQAAPSVSVVIPCFNEERFVVEVLEGVARQCEGLCEFEILVVDGMSTDGTRDAVARFAESRPSARVRLVDNPARNIPSALNRGIEAARGRFIARMDAHAVPSENYLRDCLAALGREGVAVVGMPCRIRPGADTSVALANAAAVSHPFGIGDAKYRTAGAGQAPSSQFVDTVPFGVFEKGLWRELGGYDEGLLTNEDYDFNYRVRRGGGGVLLDTSGYCTYFARPTWAALARQYFRYGTWKARMVRMHPRSVKPRQLAAPAFVCALAVLGAASFWLAAARVLLALMLGAYALLSLASSLQLARRERESRILPLVPVSFLLIHLAWGAGFLLGLAGGPRGGGRG
jgi:cellulose synthase/poly-beta-1,6-N-acetylglucosamine synthase-like glycosyltransferase